MLARVGLDEKHAPGDDTQAPDDDTQAPDDNARLKARRRSVLFWWAHCPRCCTSASLCWGVESETAGGPARRRIGSSGDEGGLGESVPLSLESENLSPNSRPPPIVDPAAVAMRRGDAVSPRVAPPLADLHDTRVQSKIHGLANLAAARATCQPAAVARRSQARRGAHPTQRGGGRCVTPLPLGYLAALRP